MPAATDILDGLTAITNDWVPLAVLWHVYFGVLAGLISGRRLRSRRLAGGLLALPMFSVGLLAWSVANLFNGVIFLTGGMVLLLVALSLGTREPPAAGPVEYGIGTMLFLFGWIYPHFLATDNLLLYAVAAPLGLLPCPTLAMIAGLTLILRGLDSIAWLTTIGGMSLLYGLLGTIWLGVSIDGFLIVGALFAVLSLTELYLHRDEAQG